MDNGQPPTYADHPANIYSLNVGVLYGTTPTKEWGLAIKEPTARKLLTPAAVTLGERRGGQLWYPYPHGVALVFENAPAVAKSAAFFLKLELASQPGRWESLIRSKWPEYFEGTVAAPLPRLRPGDQLRAVEHLGKGLEKDTILTVDRVTPSMIWVNERWRVPQEYYIDGKVVKVGSSLRTAAIRLAASQPAGSELRRGILAALFPSSHDIGDPVWVESQGQRLAGHVRSVSFASGKVRYAVQVDGSTFRALDSVLVQPREGIPLQYDFDNEG